MTRNELPEFRPWSIAAVRLLQGVVYEDDPRVWDVVLASRSPLQDYFARLGLLLVVDEPERLAYLRQLVDDECPDGYDELPKLFRKTRLGCAPTLLSVLLREELRRFEEEDVQNERCVVETTELFEQWRSLFSSREDEVRQQKELAASLNPGRRTASTRGALRLAFIPLAETTRRGRAGRADAEEAWTQGEAAEPVGRGSCPVAT